jgi:hypothetical protein
MKMIFLLFIIARNQKNIYPANTHKIFIFLQTKVPQICRHICGVSNIVVICGNVSSNCFIMQNGTHL